MTIIDVMFYQVIYLIYYVKCPWSMTSIVNCDKGVQSYYKCIGRVAELIFTA